MRDGYHSATVFYNKYIKLTDMEKETFGQLCLKLLDVNYLCTQRERDRESFYFILAHLEVFTHYLALIDYRLTYNERDKVIAIRHEEAAHRMRLKKKESVILLLLSKLYHKKMRDVTLNDEILVSLQELHEALYDTGILDARMTRKDLSEVLKLLKRHHLIEIHGAFDDDDTLVTIYPTILYAVDQMDIDAVDQRLMSYRTREEEHEETGDD